MGLLTAALLGAPSQPALRLEPDMAAERRGREINLFTSLSDFDQLHLDFFAALST